MTVRHLLFVALAGFVAACSSSSSGSSSGGTKDAAPADTGVDAVANSECGHPGDVGNEIGVGRFCQTIQDCIVNTKATVCTTLGDDKNFFCTLVCVAGGPADQCGTAASCACQGGQCGCHPDACGGPIDSGAPAADAAGTDASTD